MKNNFSYSLLFLTLCSQELFLKLILRNIFLEPYFSQEFMLDLFFVGRNILSLNDESMGIKSNMMNLELFKTILNLFY